MARVTYVAKAQASKRPRSCFRCQKPIEVGDPYKWFAMKVGRGSIRKNFCSSCQIERSDQTTSGQLATLWGAVDSAEKEIQEADEPGDMKSALEGAAEGAREAAEMYRESAQNIEDGFGHPTYVSEELGEKADELEGFADSLNSFDFQEDEFDEDAARVEVEDENDEGSLDEDEILAEIEAKRDEWIEARRSEASDALSESPF